MPPTVVTGPDEQIPWPAYSEQVDYEIELAVVKSMLQLFRIAFDQIDANLRAAGLHSGHRRHDNLAGESLADADVNCSAMPLADTAQLLQCPTICCHLCPRMAHQGLMDSPTHRANILSTEFTRVGIGIQNAGARGITFTQNFAD